MAKRANGQALDITLTVVVRHNREQNAIVNPFRFLYATDYEYCHGQHTLYFDNNLQLRVTTAELDSFLALRAEVMRELAAAFITQLYAEVGRTPRL